MFWVAREDFARTAGVTWERSQLEHGRVAEQERFTVSDAVWRQRTGVHYVTFSDPATAAGQESPARGAAGRTTLKLGEQALTLIRFGDVAWNHTFRAGQFSASTLLVAGTGLAVEVWTDTLDVVVTPSGGKVLTRFKLSLGGQEQQVSLSLSFDGT